MRRGILVVQVAVAACWLVGEIAAHVGVRSFPRDEDIFWLVPFYFALDFSRHLLARPREGQWAVAARAALVAIFVVYASLRM